MCLPSRLILYINGYTRTCSIYFIITYYSMYCNKMELTTRKSSFILSMQIEFFFIFSYTHAHALLSYSLFGECVSARYLLLFYLLCWFFLFVYLLRNLIIFIEWMEYNKNKISALAKSALEKCSISMISKRRHRNAIIMHSYFAIREN